MNRAKKKEPFNLWWWWWRFKHQHPYAPRLLQVIALIVFACITWLALGVILPGNTQPLRPNPYRFLQR